MVTHSGFANVPHTDNDHDSFTTTGCWINAYNNELMSADFPSCPLRGGNLILPEYGLHYDFSKNRGLTWLSWNGNNKDQRCGKHRLDKPICVVHTEDGTPCVNPASYKGQRCGKHRLDKRICVALNDDGTPCVNPANYKGQRCDKHRLDKPRQFIVHRAAAE
ncbi:hypothetical protein JCM1840_002150 [Sporobolomyces johnsonii]